MQVKTDFTLKPKRCKSCKEKFTPVRPLQSCCGISCAIAHANKLKAKESTQQRKLERAERKAHKDAKDKLKSLTELANDAQVYVNKYSRLRDKNLGCISCNKPSTWHGQWHGSHYRSRGANSALRFNLYNIHKSCSVCNNYLSGAISEYRIGLIKKIGIEKVEWLENHSKSKTYSREYLIRLKKVFIKMCKRLEKRL